MSLGGKPPDKRMSGRRGTSLQSFQDSFSSLKTQYSYVKDWYRYRGESLADYAVRLYTSNVDIHVPHIENCNRLLRIIIQFITLRIIHKNNQRLTVRHLMKMKWFLGVMMLCVPEKTLQEDVQEMMGWKDTSCTEEDELGRKVYPQMNKNIKFHILRFVESIEVMKYGDNYLADDELLEETVVNGFLSDVMKSPSISLSSYSTSNLFLLLHTLASDVLTAHVLPIEVRKRVKRLVMDFRSNCWFWHSPMKAANEFLRPLVKNFLYWLRCNMESLQLACANESVLYCVRYDLRCMLKCQVYESFQHFMDVFQSVKDGLTNIELPSNAIHLLQLAKEVGGLEDANHVLSTQILKDLNRDCIMLNGIRLSANEAITALKILIANAQFKEPLIDWDDTEEMLYLSKCTWHVLHAASRTVCSGDSYLIVSDLFGGEGVSVNAPSHLPPTPICIQTQGLMFEVSTAQSYNIYNSGETDCSPLAILEATMNEMIVFKPWVRESEEECDTSRISFDDSLQRFIEGNWGMSSDFVSYNECRRFLSIEGVFNFGLNNTHDLECIPDGLKDDDSCPESNLLLCLCHTFYDMMY